MLQTGFVHYTVHLYVIHAAHRGHIHLFDATRYSFYKSASPYWCIVGVDCKSYLIACNNHLQHTGKFHIDTIRDLSYYRLCSSTGYSECIGSFRRHNIRLTSIRWSHIYILHFYLHHCRGRIQATFCTRRQHILVHIHNVLCHTLAL